MRRCRTGLLVGYSGPEPGYHTFQVAPAVDVEPGDRLVLDSEQGKIRARAHHRRDVWTPVASVAGQVTSVDVYFAGEVAG